MIAERKDTPAGRDDRRCKINLSTFYFKKRRHNKSEYHKNKKI